MGLESRPLRVNVFAPKDQHFITKASPLKANGCIGYKPGAERKASETAGYMAQERVTVTKAGHYIWQRFLVNLLKVPLVSLP